MAHDLFLEFPEHYAFVYAHEEPDGSWRSWVTFERKSDHAALKTMIGGMRHLLKSKFNDLHEAVQGAAAHAHQLVDRGDTGI